MAEASDEQPTSRAQHPTRRELLAAGAAAAGFAAFPGAAAALSRVHARAWARPDLLVPDRDQARALAVLGRRAMRLPDTVPNPQVSEGTDTIPQLRNVVVLMMENHSYDNFLGMLGRGPYELARGDGFTIASDGYPANANPTAAGAPLRAFQMPTTCQFSGLPTQEWQQSHIQFAQGTNQGFVISGSGPVAMGYWTGQNLPFTYDLATKFPIGDRWFSSLLGQTDPNRRFLIGATALGMTDDIGAQPAVLLRTPPNGTIFSRLSGAGISWMDYVDGTPQVTATTANLYPTVDARYRRTNVAPFAQFLSDAAAGTLPAFSLIDPNFKTESQEDPQNIVVGEAFLRQVVEAIGSSPSWLETILIVVWDEHGGYYDHVPPPPAIAPDDVPPATVNGEPAYDGYKRYGFRVPAIVVSPYARPGYVSSVVYDHTSVLAFLERKFNLRSMSYRDANANDLTDFLDMAALRAGQPTFPELPPLAAAGNTPAALQCSTTGPGTVPPPPPPPLPITARFTSVSASLLRRGIVVGLQASRSALLGVTIELQQGYTTIARRTLALLAVPVREVVLRVGGGLPPAGSYTIAIVSGGTTLATQTIDVP